MKAGGDEWGDRFFEMEGVDFVQAEFAVLESVKQFGIGPASGAKWFESESGAAGLAKMGEKQTG